MIYDPRRGAVELRQRVVESMSPQELRQLETERRVAEETRILIENAGFPEDIIAAIRQTAALGSTSEGELEILRVLEETVQEYPAKAYVRFKCEISIEQTGDNY